MRLTAPVRSKKFVAYTQAVDRSGAATYTITAVPDRVIVFADQDLNNNAGGARAGSRRCG